MDDLIFPNRSALKRRLSADRENSSYSNEKRARLGETRDGYGPESSSSYAGEMSSDHHQGSIDPGMLLTPDLVTGTGMDMDTLEAGQFSTSQSVTPGTISTPETQGFSGPDYGTGFDFSIPELGDLDRWMSTNLMLPDTSNDTAAGWLSMDGPSHLDIDSLAVAPSCPPDSMDMQASTCLETSTGLNPADSATITPIHPITCLDGSQAAQECYSTEQKDAEGQEVHADITNLDKQESADIQCDTCFGEIISTATSSFKGEAGKRTARVKIEPFGNVLKLEFTDSGKYAGIVSMPVLITLLQRYTLRLAATLVAPKTSKESKGGKSESNEDAVIRVLVYGCINEKEAVGASLSEAEVFLQHPSTADYDPSMPYVNPHYLIRPGSEMPKLEDLVLSDDDEDSAASDPLPAHEKNKILRIFDSANLPFTGTHDGTHDGALSSPRLSATLKEHQLVALSMMVERESGRFNDLVFPSIWERVRTGRGHRYRNRITGSVEMEPRPLCGGILADDMGLGKTLSLLALVCLSLDRFDAQQLPSNSPRATLIVTTKSTIPGWEKQIKMHIKPSQVRHLIYHGPKRQAAKQAFSQQYDIVITTYETLKLDWVAGSGLYSETWYRLVLDEAHRIQNRSSQIFNAAASVKTHYRWCLTGTPIRNSLNDYGALLSFLRVPTFEDTAAFKRWIATPVTQESPCLQNLQCLVSATVFRRTKAMVKTTLELPPKVEKTEYVQLTVTDRQLYDFFKAKASKATSQLHGPGQAVSQLRGNVKESTLAIINILRLICNHGEHLLPAAALDSWQRERSKRIKEQINSEGGIMPPGVGSGDDADDQTRNDANPSSEAGLSFSAKVKALLKNLRKEQLSPGKSVVFSQWTKMLDLVAPLLHENGYKYVRIDGQSSLAGRQSAIQRFSEDASCTVMLASIGSAAEGIDLTAARYVHLLEPHWNPMVEAQAVDRVHRIGQAGDVFVTRYLTENSIEDYVRWIQEDKLRVIDQSLGSAAMSQLELDSQRLQKLQLNLGILPASVALNRHGFNK